MKLLLLTDQLVCSSRQNIAMRRASKGKCFSRLGQPRGEHVVLIHSTYPLSLLYRTVALCSNKFTVV